jgi:hypothetical protein
MLPKTKSPGTAEKVLIERPFDACVDVQGGLVEEAELDGLEGRYRGLL